MEKKSDLTFQLVLSDELALQNHTPYISPESYETCKVLKAGDIPLEDIDPFFPPGVNMNAVRRLMVGDLNART